jgi:hypothetical protein
VLFIEFYYFSKKKKIPQAKGIFQGLEIKRKRKKKKKEKKEKVLQAQGRRRRYSL